MLRPARAWAVWLLTVLLWALLWALLPASARATDATLWLASGVDADRARAAAALLGHVDAEVRPVGELARAVEVVGVVDRRIETLCGGPVDVGAWRTRLEEGRAQLQLLDLQGALSSFAMLEAELPCLTGLLSPGDVFRFHLSAAEVQLVTARSEPAGSELAGFYRSEARYAARRAAAAAPYVGVPADTLVEARQLLAQVRTELSAERPARVVVAGPYDRVWWNGTPADRVPFDVPPGTHVFQLTDGTRRVVAVQVTELAPGGAAVIWARPDATPLSTDDVLEAARTLAETGRAPIGLAPSLRALSLDGPSYVVTGDAEQVKLWGADGELVRLRLVDPPSGRSTASERGRMSSGGGSGGGIDGALVVGLVGGVASSPVQELAGVALGARVGVAAPVVLTASVEAAAHGLPGSEDWPGTGRVAVHGGPRYRLPTRWWDVGVEGGVAVLVGQGSGGGALPLVRGITSIRLPPTTLAGLRLSAHGGWQPAGFVAGGALLLDLGG